jgi:hypothetical protein
LHFLHYLCIDRIQNGRGTGIFSSDSFLNLCRETFESIFLLVLNKYDALSVCDAGIKWAKAFCEREHLEKSGENIRMVLGEFWPMLPFADLEPVEFIRYRRELGDIFPSEQIKMIIDKMASIETDSDTSMDETMEEANALANYEEEDTDSDCSASNMESESDHESLLEEEDDIISGSELEFINKK